MTHTPAAADEASVTTIIAEATDSSGTTAVTTIHRPAAGGGRRPGAGVRPEARDVQGVGQNVDVRGRRVATVSVTLTGAAAVRAELEARRQATGAPACRHAGEQGHHAEGAGDRALRRPGEGPAAPPGRPGPRAHVGRPGAGAVSSPP